MNLVTPLGLIALTGLLVVAFIFILKSKNTEVEVSSTYLWELSLKFRKQKRVITLLSQLISFILIALMVLIISFFLCSPLFTTEGAGKEYIFVVDASASMKAGYTDDSRFDRAKAKMAETVENMPEGSVVSIIYASNSPSILIEKERDKKILADKIESLTPTDYTCSSNEAFVLAQSLFVQNAGADVIFYTDSDCENESLKQVKNDAGAWEMCPIVTVENVAYEEEWNACIHDLTFADATKGYEFIATVGLYAEDSSAPESFLLSLFVDDHFITSRYAEVPLGEKLEVVFDTTIDTFDHAELVIDAEDNLETDNSFFITSTKVVHRKILVVGTQAYFLQSVIEAIDIGDVVSVPTYSGETGFDLYVFDGITPSPIPTDGPVWSVNPPETFNDGMYAIADGTGEHGKLEQGTEDGTAANLITRHLVSQRVDITKTIPLRIFGATETIFTINKKPVVIAGRDDNGIRNVTFAFDIHNSNLPLLTDFVNISKGVIEYLIPNALGVSNIECGSSYKYAIDPMASSIYVTAPSEKQKKFSTYSDFITLSFEEVGSYEISQIMPGDDREVCIYSYISEKESNFSAPGPVIIMTWEDGIEEVPVPKETTIYWPLLVALLALLLIEWLVYYREQY